MYCDAGEEDDVHGGYFERYGSDVVDFVVAQYDDGSDNSSSTSATVAPTSSQTGTATESATETSSTATETESDSPEETGSGDDDSGAVALGASFAALLPLGLAALWQVL